MDNLTPNGCFSKPYIGMFVGIFGYPFHACLGKGLWYNKKRSISSAEVSYSYGHMLPVGQREYLGSWPRVSFNVLKMSCYVKVPS